MLKSDVFFSRVYRYLFLSLFFAITVSYGITNFLLALITLVFVAELFYKRDNPIFYREFKLIYWAILLLFLAYIVSTIFGVSPKHSLRELTLFKSFILLIIALARLPKDKKFLQQALFFFLIGTAISIFYSFYEKTQNISVYYRVHSFWGHYMTFGTFLTMSSFVILSAFYLFYNRWIRLGLFLLLVLNFLSLIFTQDRGQLFSVILGYLIFGLIFVKKYYAKIIVLLLLILGMVFVFSTDGSISKRIKPLFFKNGKIGFYVLKDPNLQIRFSVWRNAHKIMMRKKMLVGIGLGNSRWYFKRLLFGIANFHNNFVEMDIGMGYLGLIALVFLIFSFIYLTLQVMKISSGFIYWYSVCLLLIVINYFVVVGFLNFTIGNYKNLVQLTMLSSLSFVNLRNESNSLERSS